MKQNYGTSRKLWETKKLNKKRERLSQDDDRIGIMWEAIFKLLQLFLQNA